MSLEIRVHTSPRIAARMLYYCLQVKNLLRELVLGTVRLFWCVSHTLMRRSFFGGDDKKIMKMWAITTVTTRSTNAKLEEKQDCEWASINSGRAENAGVFARCCNDLIASELKMLETTVRRY